MLSPIEKRNLGLFLKTAHLAISAMANRTIYPELKIIYERIADNLSHVPLNIRPGSNLNSDGLGTVYGENVKRVYAGVLQSAIKIPHDHLFDESGHVRIDGALTLLHEESHVILPRSAQLFTAKAGLAPEHADEFFADLLSAHLGKNIGISREAIGNHLRQRRSYFNFPIDRFILDGRKGVAKEIEAGRFTPRSTRKPEPRDPFRAPEARGGWGIFPKPRGLREGPSFLPGLGEKPRMPIRRL